MDTKSVLRDQARIAKQLAENYEDFRAKFGEKSLTRSAYTRAREQLEDWIKAAKENHETLTATLDSRNEYFMRGVYDGILATTEAFQELLNNPAYSAAPLETSDQETNKILTKEDLESAVDRLNNDRKQLEDDRKMLNDLEDAVKKLEVDRTKLEDDRRGLEEERRNHQENPDWHDEGRQTGRADLTKDLADLLYDIKKNREDDVENFADDPLQWLKFRNMFHLSVHSKTIPELQKFSILVKKITGPKGKAVLDGIVYDPANYEDAWKAIIKQFHTQSQLVRIELQEFGKMPSLCKTSNKGPILREIFYKTNRLLTNLKSIFKEEQDYSEEETLAIAANAMIVYAIENNLDDYTKLQWGNARKDKQVVPSYQELLEFLDQRAANIEYYVEPLK